MDGDNSNNYNANLNSNPENSDNIMTESQKIDKNLKKSPEPSLKNSLVRNPSFTKQKNSYGKLSTEYTSPPTDKFQPRESSEKIQKISQMKKRSLKNIPTVAPRMPPGQPKVQLGYLPQFPMFPLKEHYSGIGFFETLTEGLTLCIKERPDNPVKFLGQWLVDNDKGQKVNTIPPGYTLFNQGVPSGGSYKENMAKKRDERLKKRLDRKNGEEGQGRSYSFKKKDKPETTNLDTNSTIKTNTNLSQVSNDQSFPEDQDRDDQNTEIPEDSQEEIESNKDDTELYEKQQQEFQNISKVDTSRSEIMEGEQGNVSDI